MGKPTISGPFQGTGWDHDVAMDVETTTSVWGIILVQKLQLGDE